jgi:hypothetical protein
MRFFSHDSVGRSGVALRSRAGGRRAVAAIAATPGAVLGFVVRMIRVATALVAALICLAIGLRLVGANPHNAVAHAVHSGANLFAGSFTTLFVIAHHPKLSLAVDWGIALFVVVLAGLILAGLVAGISPAPRRGAGAADGDA